MSIHTNIRIIAAVVSTEVECDCDCDLSVKRGEQIEIVAEIEEAQPLPFGTPRKRTVVTKHFDAFKLFEDEDKEFVKTIFE